MSALPAMLADARARGYAAVAMNVVDAVSMAAVVQAAGAIDSPVIVQTSASVARRFGPEVIAATFKRLAAHLRGSIALQLDHCADEPLVRACIDAGWDGVMFDGSAAGLAENVRRTRAVVDMAHAAGVAVEGELEAIRGREPGVHASEEPLRPIRDSLAFIEATGVDAFAPSFGNVHGRTSEPAVLDIARLTTLRAASDVPLVLHGGTGMGETAIAACINAGIVKMNVSTDLREAYLSAARDYTSDLRNDDPVVMFDRIARAVAASAARSMAACGSAGRALGSVSVAPQ